MTRPTEHYGPPGEGKPLLAGHHSRSRKRVRLALVPSVLLVIVVSAAVAYLLGTSGSRPAAASTPLTPPSTLAGLPPDSTAPHPGTPQTGTQASAQSGTAAASAPSGGALPLPPAQKTQATAWAAGSGGAELAAVSSHLGQAMQAGGTRRYVEMRTACGRLASDVKTAQAGPPIPEAAMQALYAKALADLAMGATNCQAAVSQQTDGGEYILAHVNTAILHQSTAALVAGARELFQATAEIQTAGRQH